VEKLQISNQELDKISNMYAWKRVKYTFHIDTIIAQVWDLLLKSKFVSPLSRGRVFDKKLQAEEVRNPPGAIL
jgi:hypothetical protein